MVKNILVFLLGLTCFGCDQLYGPGLRNEFPEEIKITAYREDGKKQSGLLPPCGVAAIGPIDSQRSLPATVKVTVEWKGDIIHEFSEEELRKMLKKEESGGSYAGWDIGPSGVHFSEERACSLENKKE